MIPILSLIYLLRVMTVNDTYSKFYTSITRQKYMINPNERRMKV